MYTLASFVDTDRRNAIVRGEALPEQMSGSLLFADITGYTARVQEAREKLGENDGAEKMTQLINQVFEALINEVSRYDGVVVGFGGDAITCWFMEDDGLGAATCGLAIQQVMERFQHIKIMPMDPFQLSIKVVIAVGSARRFVVGVEKIQRLDVLAGEVMAQLAVLQKCAETDHVVLSTATALKLGSQIQWQMCQHESIGYTYARVQKVVQSTTRVSAIEAVNSSADAELTVQLRSWLLRPVYDLLAPGASAFLAEFRSVVVLFLRFTGIEYSADPDAGIKLNNFLSFIQQIVKTHNGFVIKLTIDDKGSYVMCTFGAPLAHEAQVQHSLAAALQIKAESSSFPFIAQIQMGIAEGELLVGAFGSAKRAAYDVLGPAANLAARLMMVAQPGQILTTVQIQSGINKEYQFDWVAKRELKGIGFVELYELQSHNQPDLKIFNQELIGREQEHNQLGEWLREAQQNHGRTIRIEGAAGVGKSHLRAKFVERCSTAGFAIAQGICDSAFATSPYAPWYSILFALLEIDPVDPNDRSQDQGVLVQQIETKVLAINPEWDVRLPILYTALQLSTSENEATTEFSSSQRQESFFTLVIDLIRSCVRDRPLLIAIEDAQWIDEASLLLAFAVDRAIQQLPVLFLLIHRPIEPEDNHQMLFAEFGSASSSSILYLNVLPQAAETALVQHHLQANTSLLLLSLVHELTQGNPFYVLALLNELKDGKSKSEMLWNADKEYFTLSQALIDKLQSAHCLQIEPETGEFFVTPNAPLNNLNLSIPSAHQTIVQSYIDRLSVSHKLTLKMASVIGRIFDEDVLGRVHEASQEIDSVQSQLTTLVERRYIEPYAGSQRAMYGFRHHILQEVTYDSLLAEQKKKLHSQVAQALEKLHTEEVERLAFHYTKADDRSKTLFYLDKAAIKAQLAHANRTALNYYEQALKLNKNWKRLKGIVEVLHILGDYDKALVYLQELETTRGISEFDLAYLWGEHHLLTSEFVNASEAFQQALTAIEGQGELVSEVQCYNKLGWIAWRNGGNYQLAQTNYQQVLTLLDDWSKYERKEAETLIDTLNSLGTLYRQKGEFGDALRYYKKAFDLFREHDNLWLRARTLENLGVLDAMIGNSDSATTYYQEALRLCRLIGDRPSEGDVLRNLAILHRERGAYKDAAEMLNDVQKIRQATGDRLEEINNNLELGILYYELGQFKWAQEFLNQGFELATKINDLEGCAYLLSNMGLVLRDQGNLEEAVTVLNQGLQFFEQTNNQHQIAFFHSYLATVQLAMGNLIQAEEDAALAIAVRSALTLTARIADDTATLALIEMEKRNWHKAQKYAQEVWTILENCQGAGPEFPQRCYFVCYQVFHAIGKAQEAKQALQAAHRFIVQRANLITEAELRQSFLNNVSINRMIVEAMTKA